MRISDSTNEIEGITDATIEGSNDEVNDDCKVLASSRARKTITGKMNFKRQIDLFKNDSTEQNQKEDSITSSEKRCFDSGMEHSPVMLAIYKTMIKENTQTLTTYLRSSLEVTMHELLDAVKSSPSLQIFQQKLENQEQIYLSKIASLQKQNIYLTAELNNVKSRLNDVCYRNAATSKRNDELNQILNDLKMKSADFVDEYKNTLANLKAMSDYSKQMTKERDELMQTNKLLMETNENLKIASDDAKLKITNAMKCLTHPQN